MRIYTCESCQELSTKLAEGKADNKRLREAVEFAEDVFMGTVPNHPELESGWALAELRRHAVGRGGGMSTGLVCRTCRKYILPTESYGFHEGCAESEFATFLAEIQSLRASLAELENQIFDDHLRDAKYIGSGDCHCEICTDPEIMARNELRRQAEKEGG